MKKRVSTILKMEINYQLRNYKTVSALIPDQNILPKTFIHILNKVRTWHLRSTISFRYPLAITGCMQ